MPDAILLKPGPLNADEEKQVREHPLIGESSSNRFLRPLTSCASSAIITRNSADATETLMRGAVQQWDRELVSLFLAELPAIRFEVAA